MKFWIKWTILSLAVVFLVVVVFVIYKPLVSVGEAQPQEVLIRAGAGSAEVASILIKKKIVRSGPWFLLFTLATGQEKNLKAGRYLLSPEMNIPEVVDILVSGQAESDDIVVVIPEGFNVWEIDRRLASQGLVRAGSFVAKALSLEGTLFPDSYRLTPTNSDDKIKSENELIDELISKMRENFRRRVGEITLEQLVIASLLEKEVQSDEDMALVAGIIYRRLELGMALQIDASVAYGACLAGAGLEVPPFSSPEIFCDVSQINLIKWLPIDTAFNTYRRQGLPLGPISNPGLQALEAVSNPRSSEYLYYLSARDDGRTIFSKTAQEHGLNRQRYR